MHRLGEMYWFVQFKILSFGIKSGAEGGKKSKEYDIEISDFDHFSGL